MKKYVVFYRVSTKKQGNSGLGLEAQQRDVSIYLNTYSEQPYKVVSTHTSIHSGSDIEECPHFQDAIAACKNNGATLLVAKVDRLSRKVSVFSRVIEEVDVKVAMMPNADKFQLHIYAALAEQERDFISKRTKAALAEAKSRGVKLGGVRAGHDKAIAAKKEAAKQRAEKLRPMVLELIKSNQSNTSLAKAMTNLQIDGKKWQPTQVKRLLKTLSI
ncbi:DNA invertase [Pseudoalteromonas sp. S3260]|jgi:DNA invertase Pin-like site-specific DNA recombinase|uniref:recombinase family protein n=1 Tax=Pseudoalteromonas sp. S3260 TaxID=579534 RepID=UPI00110B9E89|nr:recombinase family protein [Pseudoalteromonas sp. S3260]TMO98430.1 DNA invertase [Pseudoalteromonas sp. S3260]